MRGRVPAPRLFNLPGSEGAEEYDQVCLGLEREPFEVLNDLTGFASRTFVFQAGLDHVRRTAVMQEEHPLADPPQRRSPELVWTGISLRDAVGKSSTHVMQGQIREEIGLHPRKSSGSKLGRRCGQQRRVTVCATDLHEDHISRRSLRAGDSRAYSARGGRLIQEAHEDRKLRPVGETERRVEDCEVLRRRVKQARGRNWIWRIPTLVGKQLVGYTHFHVVGFPREDEQGFVLSLPAEAGDAAIVAAAIGNTVNS